MDDSLRKIVLQLKNKKVQNHSSQLQGSIEVNREHLKVCQGWGIHRIHICAVCAHEKEQMPCPRIETHSYQVSLGNGCGGPGTLPTYLCHLGHGFLYHFRLIRQSFLLLLGRENRVQRGPGPGPALPPKCLQPGELGEQLPGDPQGCASGVLREKRNRGPMEHWSTLLYIFYI